ncbi:Cytochrome b6-f complex iron-sulfur subunit [compost metagenome]
MEPLDFLGFIGKNPDSANVYIVTGDSGNGITHGTIAGILISDLINEKSNPWADLYSPNRINMKVVSDYLHEVSNMVFQYADYLHKSEISSTIELDFNKGAIINHNALKVAVYRDLSGQLHAFNAICPHLGCLLKWNDDEKTFDCPCHGSRFTNLGVVINGPAIDDLKQIEVRDL